MTDDIIQTAREACDSLHNGALAYFLDDAVDNDKVAVIAALDLAERLQQDNERLVKERDEARGIIRKLEMLYMDGIGNRGGGFKDCSHDGRWYESADLSQTMAALKEWCARQALGDSE